MKKSKIAFAAASALLLTTALSNAQTTVGGNMRVGIKASSADLTGGLGSGSMFTKETQINVANKGKLNIGGLEYAAGFSIENDGGDTGAGSTHYESNYINIINPSSGTTLSFGADHIKPSDVQLSDIVGAWARVDHVAAGAATSSVGTGVTATIYSLIGDKGSNEGFGVGLVQQVGTFGTVRYIYQPDVSETSSALADTGGAVTAGSTTNSLYDISFRGSLGVKGLEVLYSQNKQDGTGTDKDIKFDSQGIKYTFGQFTGAFQKADGTINTTGTTVKSKEYGLAYAVSKDLTIGLTQIKSSQSGLAPEEKIKGITIGYSLGPVALGIIAADISDAAGVAGQDGKSIHLSLGATF